MLLNIPRLALSIFLVLAAFSPAFSEAKYSVARIEATGWDSLVAEIDGISCSITTEDWEFLPLMSIEHQLDLDGDGFLEAILSTHHGGNAIGPHFFVVSHRGDAFFSISTSNKSNWPDISVVQSCLDVMVRFSACTTKAISFP